MSLKINRKELDEKNKLVDDVVVQLKKEFVGIDEQIDSIMKNVRVWFLYPELQTSPCVVNIFGMTGCGKTSLIKRIAQLLDIEKNLVYFNFCAINEQNSWEIEQDIEEQLDNECSSRMFVYDEFQYAATLDSHGEEKDNKNGLKPFWELLDTGILHKRNSYWHLREVSKALNSMLKINGVCQMEVIDGIWRNDEECLMGFDEYDKKQFKGIFNINSENNPIKDEDCCSDYDVHVGSMSLMPSHPMRCEEEKFFIQNYVMDRFCELYRKVYNIVCENADMYRKLRKMSVNEICDIFHDVYEKSLAGYDLKFNNSIIFVIANLDEAYNVAFDVNPDMSPDQFYNITKKISIVDIKKALQKRFRNEQIARLGNIHVIYQSFSSKSFKKIIELKLNSYKDDVKKLCGIDVEFDKSIHKVIYSEAVYPTQGTRPIFSTIHEFVKTKLPYIIRNVCESHKDEMVESIRYSYKGKKNIVYVLDSDGNVIDTYKFTDNLRLNKLRESMKDEKQANTAVHESGHFVMYSYLNGKIPEKLVSRSVESDTEGFMMHSFEDEDTLVGSQIDYMNKIKVCLGGYVAEGIVFGVDRRSAGASNDLENATMIASRMVRRLGMGGLPYTTTYMNDSNTQGMIINEDNQEYINEKIKVIIEMCLTEAEEIIRKPNIYDMLKKSSKYLAEHSQMPKHIMNELLDEARENGEICDNADTYYRDVVQNL